MNTATFYKWHAKYGGMDTSVMASLKELELENQRLKKMYAEERYNRTVRYDWLAQNLFENREEVQHGVTAWLWTCNNERPKMALGGITPKQKLHQPSLTLR